MPTITAPSGQTVAFEDTGGDGPALVLLHSFAMDGSMFAPQRAAFSATHRCITVDERGHGGSVADAPFGYWDVAEDVLAVLDHLGVDGAVVAGTSQGGFVALRVALVAPERVRGLVLMGTSADAEDPAVAEQYRGLARTWQEQGAIDPLVDTLAAICLGDAPAEDWKARWRQLPGDVFARNLEALVSRDSLVPRLGEVSAPALVLHGGADAAYPVALAQAIAAGLPNAAPLVVVDGGAHFLSLTDAEAVNAHLAAFLDQVAASAGTGPATSA